jgi:hypothetical protein
MASIFSKRERQRGKETTGCRFKERTGWGIDLMLVRWHGSDGTVQRRWPALTERRWRCLHGDDGAGVVVGPGGLQWPDGYRELG